MRRIAQCLCLTLCLALFACSEDEALAPAYREDMAELLTDGAGDPAWLMPDGGDTLRIVSGGRLSGAEPGRAYRVRALYVLVSDGAAVSDAVQVLTPVPRRYAPEQVVTDPLHVVAVWRGGRYLNFRLSVSTSGGGQVFGIADEGIEQMPSGGRLLRLVLIHDQGDDGTYYSREVYLSAPLAGYSGSLVSGRDSLEVCIRTYDADFVRRYPY